MKTIEHVTDIDAPAEAVWAVLSDTEHYPDWNPFLAIEQTPVAVGQKLNVTVRPGRRTMTFHPVVTTYTDGHEVSWLGHFLIPGFVDGAHTLSVEELPDGTSRFIQRETFRGLLVGMMKSTLRDTDAGFAAMNAALRDRVQAEREPVVHVSEGHEG